MRPHSYTKGPWTVKQRKGLSLFIIGIASSLAEVLNANFNTETFGNADLLASAPDLLAACEAGMQELIGLRAYLTTCEHAVILDNLDSLARKMEDVQAKIEAAIRKAKGELP